MAIIPTNAFPGKVDTSDPVNYPNGKARNITTSGDGTGTPWNALNLNELYGFFQALLLRSGVSANGLSETATASQYLEALQQLRGFQAFTTDGTFIPPEWVSQMRVTLVGGGGAGGESSANSLRGGGGGAAAVAYGYINNPEASYAITIGAGGLPANNTNGGSGEPSAISSPSQANIIVAGGGGGGAGGTDSVGGLGGQGSGPQLDYGSPGQAGGYGIPFEGSITGYGGMGGTGFFGAGGRGGLGPSAAGEDGVGFGSGGGGGSASGGEGAAGLCIIEYGLI